MKTFFKDNDKIIINSMTYAEALVGKQFIKDAAGKTIKIEQRNDVNDDFDGLVISLVEPVNEITEDEPTETPTTGDDNGE